MGFIVEGRIANRLRNVEANRAARFWAKVKKGGKSDCWEWQGYKDPKGYGTSTWGGVVYRSSQLALMLSGHPKPSNPTGDYVDEPLALHSCKNPPCCNPAHLRWGNSAENARDREERFYGRA